MKDENSLNDKPLLSLFDVIPDFTVNAATVDQYGFTLLVSIVEVAPNVAEKLLLTQERNRKLSDTRVLEYARRIRSTEWGLSEPLKFDENGWLIDGQHRLKAVSKAEQPEKFIFIAGMPDNSKALLDLGMNRTVAQVAQIKGMDVSHTDVAIFKAMFLVRPDGGTRSGHFDGSKVASVLSSPQFILNRIPYCLEAIHFSKTFKGADYLNFAPVRAVVARAWFHENHQQLTRFLEVMDTYIAANDVEKTVVNLRLLYNRDKGERQKGGGDFREIFARKTVSVLEAFLANRPLSQIREKQSCKWPAPGVDHIPEKIAA